MKSPSNSSRATLVNNPPFCTECSARLATVLNSRRFAYCYESLPGEVPRPGEESLSHARGVFIGAWGRVVATRRSVGVEDGRAF